MEFDLQRAAVVAGDGIVARFPGVLCVARCPDPEALRELLELCAAASGDDPGLALSRSLAKWLAAADLPHDLAFGTVAPAGEQLAVFLNGAVAVEIVADRQRLSGIDAVAWTDRLLPLPDSPVVLALHDAMAGGAVMSRLGLLDLRLGVVPGAGVVVRPDHPGDRGRGESVRPAASRPPAPPALPGLDRSPLAPDVDRSSANGRSAPVAGPSADAPQTPAPPLRAVAEAARNARPVRVDRKLAAVPEPRLDAPTAAGVLGGDHLGATQVDGDGKAGEWFRPDSGAEPAGGAGGPWIEPGPRHPGRHAVHDPRSSTPPVDEHPGVPGRPAAVHPLDLPVNGASVRSIGEAPTPSHGDSSVPSAPHQPEPDRFERHQPDLLEPDCGPDGGPDNGSDNGSAPAPRTAPRRAETVVGLPPVGDLSGPEPYPADPFGAEPAPVGPPVPDHSALDHSAPDPSALDASALDGEAEEGPGEGRSSLGLLRWDDGATYTLDGEYLVGRMPESDQRVRAGALRSIIVEDRSGAVSRVHAEIRLDGRDVLLIDTGSRNGTFVAGPGQPGWSQLTPGQSQRLGAGTRVRMGGRTFVYEPSDE